MSLFLRFLSVVVDDDVVVVVVYQSVNATLELTKASILSCYIYFLTFYII